MRGHLRSVLAALLFQAVLVSPSSAPAQNPPPPPLVTTVAGITSFTRWPVPLDGIVLCLIGPIEGSEAFFTVPVVAGGRLVIPRRMGSAGDRLEECNATYAGRLTPAERQQLFRRVVGRPVLTMGDMSPECSETTMFCLRRGGAAITFSTNIDMISRGGGLRINPRVLQLGRPAVPP